MEIRALTMTVKPAAARSKLPAVTQNLLLVEEVGGPGDGTDVSGLLHTILIKLPTFRLTVFSLDSPFFSC